jgi:hypothetical protein
MVAPSRISTNVLLPSGLFSGEQADNRGQACGSTATVFTKVERLTRGQDF